MNLTELHKKLGFKEDLEWVLLETLNHLTDQTYLD